MLDAEDDSTEDEAGLPARLPGVTLPEGPLLVAHETEALAPRASLRRLVASALGCVRRLAASRPVRADAALRRALLAAFAAAGAPAEAEGVEQVRKPTERLCSCSGLASLQRTMPPHSIPHHRRAVITSHHASGTVHCYDAGASGLQWSVQLL